MGDATKYPLADLIEALASELREANQRAVERPDKARSIWTLRLLNSRSVGKQTRRAGSTSRCSSWEAA
jgi:hypothetical protein